MVADSLTAAFAKHAGMDSLTEMQAESLARVSAFFVARPADTSEDHGNRLSAALIFRAPNEWGTPVLFF